MGLHAGGGWASYPGAAMRPSRYTSFPGEERWFELYVNTVMIEFVIHDGNNNWYNHNGATYKFNGGGKYTKNFLYYMLE